MMLFPKIPCFQRRLYSYHVQCQFSSPLPSPSLCTSTEHNGSIVECLRKLPSMPRRKNILKRLDYDSLRTVNFEFLLSIFDGDVVFIFLPISSSAAQSKAKSMEGMDKQYDGHVWTKTMTTNISNNLGLTFLSLTCVGHLQCINSDCEYLQRAYQTSLVNDTEFEGFSKNPFSFGGPPSMASILVCKICKISPTCKAMCDVRIFYVHSNDSM